jgi:hypothetical protein
MTETKGPAARRFREFGRAVRTLARAGTDTWPKTFAGRYLEAMDVLVENYMAAIPALRRLMEPPTFVAGARVILVRYLESIDIVFESTARIVGHDTRDRSCAAALSIEHTICPGDHAWIWVHCSKCFANRGATAD